MLKASWLLKQKTIVDLLKVVVVINIGFNALEKNSPF